MRRKSKLGIDVESKSKLETNHTAKQKTHSGPVTWGLGGASGRPMAERQNIRQGTLQKIKAGSVTWDVGPRRLTWGHWSEGETIRTDMLRSNGSRGRRT